jgi:hypothetical protein
MAKPSSTIELEADPNDSEDFAVTAREVELGLAERRNRGGATARIEQGTGLTAD